jgi:putative zinc finger protein
MNETFCNYSGKRDETIVGYLYGEMEADERALFDRHLVACAPCRAELADLRVVRSELARSASPELAGHIPFDVALPAFGGGTRKAARSIPVWAQAIAATLLLGVAAGVANLDVTYSRTSGLSIRTGWKHPADANSAQGVPAPGLAVQSASSTPAPWKTDLTALERELRDAIDRQLVAVSTVSSNGSDEAVLRRVRQLVQDSEKRQESELALRVAEAVRELQMQRQADLVKIDRTLGFMQNRTGIEVMRTQRQMNSLAQQVSQRP